MESICPASTPKPPAAPLPTGAHAVSTDNLFKSARCLVIEHQGERYLLRLTRNGKLILTK